MPLIECRNHKNTAATIKDKSGCAWCPQCKSYATLMNYGYEHHWPELVIDTITLQAGEGIWKIRIPRLTLSVVEAILETITITHYCFMAQQRIPCSSIADYQDSHDRYWCFLHAPYGSKKLYSNERQEVSEPVLLHCYACGNLVQHYDAHNRAWCHKHAPECHCVDKTDEMPVEVSTVEIVKKPEQDNEDYCSCGEVATFYDVSGLPQCKTCYLQGKTVMIP